MKDRKNFKIVWYIIAVLLLLAGVSGLNLAIESNNIQNGKTTDSTKNSKLNIALVNEDQSVTEGTKTYNLGASYIKSIEKDNSQNWSVVSRGTAESGLKRGDYQLMVTIPSDFSQKVLDVNNSSADQTVINYKVNTAGNLELEKEATKKGKDIVADLNSQLVDMYMASVLSNLYTAQQNVQTMIDVQNGNVSTYQKNLVQSANGFQDIFPALISSSNSSVSANDALKKSLETYSTFYNGLTETQNGFGDSLNQLIEKRSKDEVTYGDFTKSLMEINFNDQLQPTIDEIKNKQAKLLETMGRIYQTGDNEPSPDQPTDSTNPDDSTTIDTSHVKRASEQIAKLQELLDDTKMTEEDKLKELYDSVDNTLKDYFEHQDISEDITLNEFLQKAGPSEQTKDFAEGLKALNVSLFNAIPAVDVSTLESSMSPNDYAEISNFYLDQTLVTTYSVTGDKKLANRLSATYSDYQKAKAKAGAVSTSPTSTPGMQSLSVEAIPGSNLRVTGWEVDKQANVTEIDPTKTHEIVVNYDFTSGTATNPSDTTPSTTPGSTTETGNFTIKIGGAQVLTGNDQAIEDYRLAEVAYKTTLQEVKDSYNSVQTLLDTMYPMDEDGHRQYLQYDFFQQKLKTVLRDLLVKAVEDYQNSAKNRDKKQNLDDVAALLSTNQEKLIDDLVKVNTKNAEITDTISESLAALQAIQNQLVKVQDANTAVGSDQETTTTTITSLKSELESLVSTTNGAKDMAKSNSEEAGQVNSIFTSLNKDVTSAQDTGKNLSTDANSLMAAFQKELDNNGDFVESFSKVFNTAYNNGVPNNVLLDFLSRPVTEDASSVKATVNVYRPFTWILLLEVVSLFTAYVFATQNLVKKITNRYKVNKFQETDFLNVGVVSGLALVSGLVLGTVSSRSLYVPSEYVPSWIMLVLLFSFLLVQGQYFLLKNLKAIGMGLSLFMIISFVYLSNAIGTVATVRGLPKFFKMINPLSILEGKLSAYFDNISAGAVFFIGCVIAVIVLIVLNILVTLNFNKTPKEK
ncbi:type VII secretion protein EsaA [Streptococcus parauberis]|uniref:type VII secretion protein EsaA n=1 Tax=Streptococcus parauberis TaxID=1348 RepID=UPI000CCE2BAA|nr:type VII secretion protein EsaA [Streptococcus parauberis]PNY19779.1 hypothetical protein ASN86_00604 [Streptococcus parauberis]